MCYKKLFLAAVVVAGLSLMGCNKDKDKGPKQDALSNVDLERIMNSPYSTLSPDEQKVKLENESIDILNELKPLSSLQVFDAFQYFIELIDEYGGPDIEMVTEGSNPAQEILQVSNGYGVYTWNASKKNWTQTASTSELKFIFPASAKSSSNNATLSLTAGSTGITITQIWYDDYWDEDCWCYKSYDEPQEGIIHIPTSVTGTLTVDSKTAKVEISATYKKSTYEFDDFKTTGYPESVSYKLTFEGYVWWYTLGKSGNDTKLEMALKHNNKSVIEAMYKVGITLDQVFDKIETIEDYEDIEKVYGKVNTIGYLKLMDNLVLVYQVDDIAKFVNEMNKEEEDYYGWCSQNYFTQRASENKKNSDNLTKAMNNHLKVSLASTKDGTKIATLVVKSDVVDEYWNHPTTWNSGYECWDEDYYGWIKYYDMYEPVPYLKFGDGSVIEAEAYFTGFNNLESSWEDFVESFNRE